MVKQVCSCLSQLRLITGSEKTCKLCLMRSVILMDISMPVMNGHEATRAIRKVEAIRRSGTGDAAPINAPEKFGRMTSPKFPSRTKILALTGLATPDDKREAFDSGVDG